MSRHGRGNTCLSPCWANPREIWANRANVVMLSLALRYVALRPEGPCPFGIARTRLFCNLDAKVSYRPVHPCFPPVALSSVTARQ
jgi:hypothetical protein